MNHRKIIIGCSGAFVVFAIVVIVVVWLFYSRFVQPLLGQREIPAELREPRTITGADFLARTEFFKLSESALTARSRSIGSINDVVVSKPDGNSPTEIVIAGNYGALFVDQDGANGRQVQYQLETEDERLGILHATTTRTIMGDIQIIDIEHDHVFEYLARGSIDGAAIFDSQGKRLWSYGKFTKEKTAIDDMAAGDVTGDGVDEFVVCWDGIELFDRYGTKKWREEIQYSASQVEIVDTDGDSNNEIIYSYMGDLVIRDRKGQIVKQVDMPFYLSRFALCVMPVGKKPGVLAVEDGFVWITDFNGHALVKFNAPLSEVDSTPYQTPVGEMRGTSVYKAKGIWVRLKKDEPEYLAVIAEFAATDRSLLYVFKASGEITYQEVLPDQCHSIAVLPNSNPNNPNELLIGGEKTIWRYTAH